LFLLVALQENFRARKFFEQSKSGGDGDFLPLFSSPHLLFLLAFSSFKKANKILPFSRQTKFLLNKQLKSEAVLLNIMSLDASANAIQFKALQDAVQDTSGGLNSDSSDEDDKNSSTSNSETVVANVICAGEGGCGKEYPGNEQGSDSVYALLCALCYSKQSGNV
jgi:hypothetical protein